MVQYIAGNLFFALPLRPIALASKNHKNSNIFSRGSNRFKFRSFNFKVKCVCQSAVEEFPMGQGSKPILVNYKRPALRLFSYVPCPLSLRSSVVSDSHTPHILYF